jgi:hypothetical protein
VLYGSALEMDKRDLNKIELSTSPIFADGTASSDVQRSSSPLPDYERTPTYQPQQPAMPAAGYTQPGMPTAGYTQPGMPAAGYNQPGMPYPQPPFYPQGYYPPPPMMCNNNNIQMQQQQTTNVNVVIGQQEPVMSFRGPIALACFTAWCCNPLFGLIAYILAMVGRSEAESRNVDTAIKLSRASYGISISGILVTIIIVATVVGVVAGSLSHG